MTLPMLILLILVLLFVATSIFQGLWNTTMPEVFGIKQVTFWQAFRILLMAGILFGAGGIVHINL